MNNVDLEEKKSELIDTEPIEIQLINMQNTYFYEIICIELV